MTYLLPADNFNDYTFNQMDLADIGPIVKTLVYTKQKNDERDIFSFMKDFNFPDLKVIKKSLTKSKQYSQKQVAEILSGLGTLPEYNRA